MAYSTVSYGSSGKDVKTLQEYLNKNGYSLDVDGQFGSKTQAAVKDYQKKNGLSVDGVVGTNTWGSLSGASKSNVTATANTAPKATTSTSTPTPTRPTYTASAELTAAEKALKEWESKKPGEYVSQHSANIDALLNKVHNGEKFSYNPKEDPLFQQYKDMYLKNGKLAMNDTIATAAELTGGYNSSYGTVAAQQVYQQYLTELNNKLPEFYDREYQMYLAEKEGDYQKLALLQQLDDAEYAKYRDEISDYNTQLGYLYQKKADLSDDEWQKYQVALGNFENDRSFAESVRQYNEQMAYQKERDKVADDQWAKTYALQAAAKSSSKSSGGSSGGSSSSSSYSGKTQTKSDGGDNKEPSVSTYEDAVAYLKNNGAADATGGLMTRSEWARRKGGVLKADGTSWGASTASEAQYSSYAEYLNAYIKYKLS